MGKDNKDQIKRKSWSEGYDSLSEIERVSYPGMRGKKFKVSCGRGLGISKLGKLVTKNANRNIIKTDRQKATKSIKSEIE